MQKTTLLLTGLLVALLAAPAASAAHTDATHGVAPHSVSDQPLNIHAVSVSTPHPYPMGESFTYEIQVDGASTLSVHFERYDVNGFFSSWTGECSGSEIVITDANTGAALDSICGYQGDNDFWTPDYATDHLVLEFITGGWGNNNYGFDIYEVASDGAQPAASVPYSSQPSASAGPGLSVNPDPFNPTDSSANANVHGTAGWNAGASSHTSAQVGKFWQCSWLSCEQVDGFKVTQTVNADAGDNDIQASAGLTAFEDENAPGGYQLVPTVECTNNWSPCA